ncbi:recombinase family protein [Burkholderia ubonensis]|uniref:recombinase family protein n=1 Tax=Burkholderia ubonensis TaxID=101571 RepID=UPI000A73DF23|nr:recombinase family protein [Burkholderia ubonensis]
MRAARRGPDPAGFNGDKRRVIEEAISGSTVTAERQGFRKLLESMEEGGVVVVTKLDRLGRNAMDVQTAVQMLADVGIRVHCLALGGVDLTSAAGRMTMGVLTAVAQFERDLLIERTQAGLARTKAAGTRLGRPSVLSGAQQEEMKQRLAAGETVYGVAQALGTLRQVIMRVRDRLSA